MIVKQHYERSVKKEYLMRVKTKLTLFLYIKVLN